MVSTWPVILNTIFVQQRSLLAGRNLEENKCGQRSMSRLSTFQSYNISENFQQINYCMTVFPTVNWSWMDIWSSKGVQITGPSIKFTGHSHIPQKRCLDSYWSLGPVMNNLLLGQTNFYWTLQHVRWILGMTAI